MSDNPSQFFRPGTQPPIPPRQGAPAPEMAFAGMPGAMPGSMPPAYPQGFDPGFAFGQTAPQANPLMKYTRMPGMNVRLPSNGVYLPPGAVEFTANGELPVLPMRAVDEVWLKNPDALMSGFAVEQMLTSCVPSIKTPHLISMPDLDVLFLAIRAATYGDKMEFEVKCPKCGEENVFDANLPSLLATVTELPPECPVRLSDEVVAYMRPYNLRNATQVAIATFEETRRLQSVAEAPEQIRSQTMQGSIKRITDLSNAMTTDCVVQIVTPDGAEYEPSRIAEFMANIPSQWTAKVDAALKSLNGYGLDKTIRPACKACGHEWETQLEFDPASFFGQSS